MVAGPNEILAFTIGTRSVGDNLRRAIAAGAVTEQADGSLALPVHGPAASTFLMVRNSEALGCGFLNSFLFKHVYAEAAVPQGCAPCYKIKALPRSLRELVAMYEVAKNIPCLSKWGIDLGNPHSQDIYAGYVYVTGLEGARALYPVLRKAMTGHPKIGADVPLLIKRGCSNYEAKLGPSDQYTFAPELRAIEAALKARFKDREPEDESVATMLYGKWVPLAFQIGDDTYLDFTNGRRLYPKSVSYDPDGAQTKQPISTKPFVTG
ncbi:MAG: hypothetical protein Q7T81_16105 [Pseudolabrys sp.]|nr:hypothetical protein [Pseudolabrys sp.]